MVEVDEDRLRAHLHDVLGEGELQDLERLGEGVHGVGYRLRWKSPDGERPLILKSIHPEGFGHEYLADRAQVLLLAHQAYDRLPNHVRSVDVVGVTPTGLAPLGDVEEVMLLMEEATGTPYVEDLDRVLEDGALRDGDEERAKRLARYLADIHAETHDDPALYRRRIRDTVGHGECLLGIVDSYPGDPDFLDDDTLAELAGRAGRWWARHRARTDRLCQVHGDFHPGNIWFDGDDLTVLDRSRGLWGEPADDVTSLLINYIFYALRHRDAFEGPFRDLAEAFLDTYLDRTGDDALLELTGGFFAFRVAIVVHPVFYSDLSDHQRRRMIGFALDTLQADRFDLDKVDAWLSP